MLPPATDMDMPFQLIDMLLPEFPMLLLTMDMPLPELPMVDMLIIDIVMDMLLLRSYSRTWLCSRTLKFCG